MGLLVMAVIACGAMVVKTAVIVCVWRRLRMRHEKDKAITEMDHAAPIPAPSKELA